MSRQGIEQEAANALPAAKKIDELRAILLDQHNVAVDRDDPVLLLYSIMRICLDEAVEVGGALKAGIKTTCDHGAESIDKRIRSSLDEIIGQVSNLSIRASMASIEKSAVIMDRSVSAHKRLLRWNCILIAVSVASVGINLLVLKSVLS